MAPPKIQKTLTHKCHRQSQNSIGPIQKCIHQGPRPSLKRHSTIRTKLPSDAILQHHGSRHSKAPPRHQPQQGWLAGRSCLSWAERASERDRPCVDHIHTEPYHCPGPIWVEETLDYADLQERSQVRSLKQQASVSHLCHEQAAWTHHLFPSPRPPRHAWNLDMIPTWLPGRSELWDSASSHYAQPP